MIAVVDRQDVKAVRHAIQLQATTERLGYA